MSVFRHRYAGLNRQECDREALLLIEKAAETRQWGELPERLSELRRVMGYAPMPAGDDARVVWKKGMEPK